MIVCPDCGAENIEGVDTCGHCSVTLTELSIRVPSSTVEADLLRDRIGQLPLKKPSSVPPDMPVGQALAKMVSDSTGCVTVVDGDELVGIFSERDALMKLNVDAARYFDQPISQFMTPRPVTLEAQDKIAFALHKMNVGGYRHVPIMVDGKLEGILSIRDILAYLTERIAASSAGRSAKV